MGKNLPKKLIFRKKWHSAEKPQRRPGKLAKAPFSNQKFQVKKEGDTFIEI